MTTTQEALRLAEEALEVVGNVPNWFSTYRKWALEAIREATVKESLTTQEPPAEQEPVAAVCHDMPNHIGWNPSAEVNEFPEGMSLYTAPPAERKLEDKPLAQREWVSLTDDEIAMIHLNYPQPQGYARAIEAKLKEKNK